MSIRDLLDDLEPVDIPDPENGSTRAREGVGRASTEETRPRSPAAGEPLYDSLSRMLVLADRTAKNGFRASESTRFVSEKVGELEAFLRAEVEDTRERLRAERARIGEITDQRDRLLEALMELADLTDAAAASAVEELPPETAGRFRRFRSTVLRILRRAGMDPTAEAGEPHDPEYHEPVGGVAADEEGASGVAPGSIVDVIRQGYRHRGRTVRIAQVTVAE